MQNLENLDIFEILITQKLLKCLKDPFVRSVPKCFAFLFICIYWLHYGWFQGVLEVNIQIFKRQQFKHSNLTFFENIAIS